MKRTLLERIEARIEHDMFFTLVYREYYRYAYTIAFKIINDYDMAEDIVYDSFVKVWKYLNHCHTLRSAKGLIGIITRNAAITARRRKDYYLDHLEELPDDNDEELLEDTRIEINPEKSVVGRDSVERIYYLMEQLPETYSMAVMLRYKYELNIAEIAESLNITVSAAQNRVWRGTKLLREMIIEDGRID